VEKWNYAKEYEVLIYQIKIETKQYKTDEFVNSMRSFARRIRKQKDCLGYGVYRDSEKENTYCLIGEWKTRQAMEKHFKTNDFEVLIGATRVLGETFAMYVAKVSKTGGYEWAKELSSLKQRKSTKGD